MKHKLTHIVAYIYMLFLFALFGSLFYIMVAQGRGSFLTGWSEDGNSMKHQYEPEAIDNAKVWQTEKQAQQGLSQSAFKDVRPKEEMAEISDQEMSVDIKDIRYPELGEQYAILVCDRIRLEVPVYWGDTRKILGAGAGQYMGSFLPGFDRGILLSAHNSSFFKPLDQIEVGDIIKYDTNYGAYQYVVDEVTIINEEDAEKMLYRLLAIQKERLILYTCYPFNSSTGNKKERLFVFADKQLGPRVEASKEE